MNLHHLRVVNFDRNSSNNRVAPKARKVALNKDHRSIENKQCPKPDENSAQQNEKNKSEQQIVADVAKEYKHSPSKTDGNYGKDIAPNTLPSVRTLSLDDIGKRLKKCDSHKIKQKFKNIRLKNVRLKHNNTAKQRERKESQDDIKVLYTSQRLTEKSRRKPDRKVNLGPSRVDEVKIPSNDLFSTSSVSKLRNSVYLYYQTCKNTRPLSTRKKNNRGTQSQPHIQRCRYPLVTNNSKRDEISEKHYNLVDFSKHYKSDNYTQNNENKSPQPPYEFVCKNKHEVPNIITVPVDRGQKNQISKAVVTEPERKPVNKFKVKLDKQCACRIDKNKQENYVVQQFFKILKTLLKYFLLGLTVIAWSPCIIVAFLCWFLFSSLMPDDVNVDKVDPACAKNKEGFFSKLVEWITRVNNKIKFTFEAVKNSLNADEEIIEPSPQYNSVGTQKRPNIGIDSQPNPERKYILYHTQQKGWLMKPMQGVAKHKKCKPEVCPNIIREQPRIKKTVSFWDTKQYHKDKKQKAESKYKQTVATDPKRSNSCSCTHEKPAAPAHVSCQCYPFPKASKRIRCPFGNSKVHQRITGPPPLVRQRYPHRKYVYCPHQKSLVHHRQLSEKVKKTARAPLQKCESIPAKIICKPRQRTRSRSKSDRKLESVISKKKKKKLANTSKVFSRVKYHFNCIKCAIQQSDQSWGQGLECSNLYIIFGHPDRRLKSACLFGRSPLQHQSIALVIVHASSFFLHGLQSTTMSPMY
ncbi:hypothetical protein evm_013456 [Chilo suppressalis]|nr:hypothetical protein evm_013456 [Chilo suppressalis]